MRIHVEPAFPRIEHGRLSVIVLYITRPAVMETLCWRRQLFKKRRLGNGIDGI